jgi:tetratricopeptide (TPR) repeat protein
MDVRGQVKKDSLWNVWNDTSAPDTNRLKAIQALTWPMLNVNLDSAYLLAKMQLDFARKVNHRKWISRALYNIGAQYYLKSDYQQAISYYNQSLEIRKEIGDLKGEAAIYGNLGLIYGDQGNLLKDLEYQLKSLAINEKLNDTSNLTSNYSNLATIYQKQDDSTKALEYFNKALVMYQARDNRAHIGLLYNNMGNMYREFKNYEKAKWYLHESLRIRTELNDNLGMGISNINLGSLYISMKDFAKAKEYSLKSIEYFEKLGDHGSLANVYYNLGDIARREGKYHEAIAWCNKSLEIAEASNKIRIEAADCSCLYRSYKELGDYKKALEYFEDYVVLDDSLKEDELKIEMGRLEFEKDVLTDSLSREAEKNELRATHQQELNRKTRVTNVILIIGLGLLALALILLSRVLVVQRNSEKLKLKTQELEKQQLVNEISLLRTQVNPHFLFNSLSILSSLVRIDPDLSEQFIDQLSRSYRYILEQKDQSLVTLRTELSFIDSYAFLLKIRFQDKFNLDIDIPDEVLDKYKIAPLTLQLLVENAVKHNRMSVAEPLIIHISMQQDVLVVKNKLQPRTTEYKSTGVGLQNIMNRYALLTNRQVFAGEAGDEFVVQIPIINTENTINH